jgi:hypothetical protein
MGELYDFTEYKLHQLMEYAAELERPDIAVQIADMLDAYLMGEAHIEFVDGWPVQYSHSLSDTEE